LFSSLDAGDGMICIEKRKYEWRLELLTHLLEIGAISLPQFKEKDTQNKIKFGIIPPQEKKTTTNSLFGFVLPPPILNSLSPKDMDDLIFLQDDYSTEEDDGFQNWDNAFGDDFEAIISQKAENYSYFIHADKEITNLEIGIKNGQNDFNLMLGVDKQEQVQGHLELILAKEKMFNIALTRDKLITEEEYLNIESRLNSITITFAMITLSQTLKTIKEKKKFKPKNATKYYFIFSWDPCWIKTCNR